MLRLGNIEPLSHGSHTLIDWEVSQKTSTRHVPVTISVIVAELLLPSGVLFVELFQLALEFLATSVQFL